MSRTLVVFHGFTMNGEAMQKALAPLATALAPAVRLLCLNAPHTCSAATVERMYPGSNGAASSAPHLCWWNASEDGLEYRGWDETRELVSAALERYAPVSILGFSQGGILALPCRGSSTRRGTRPGPRGATQRGRHDVPGNVSGNRLAIGVISELCPTSGEWFGTALAGDDSTDAVAASIGLASGW